MREEYGLKIYVVQLFNRTVNSDSLVSALRHFMFEDKRNPLYMHVYENTVFIYTIHDFWNMNSLSMIIRSHLMGDYFIIYEIDEYDGLLPGVVWEKKKDAMKYYQDKGKVLSKYKRKYILNKVQKRSFLADSGDEVSTLENAIKKEVEYEDEPDDEEEF